MALNRSAEQKLLQIEAFLRLLSFLHLQVECFSLPVGEILGRSDPQILLGCGWHRDKVPSSLSELLGGIRILDVQSQRILCELADSFGRGYREEEVRLCESAERQLRERAELLRRGIEGKKKTNLTLCVAGATAFVILFV